MYEAYSKIVRPKEVKVVNLTEDGFEGTFSLEPIQRGFGLTLANSLRRILLSSIRGTAVSSVEIEGCDHEFSTIPSVSCDVVKICLNLRKIVFRSELEECIGELDVEGPCAVTAGMIKLPEGIEVVNKDFCLFNIEGNSSVKMKFYIKSGVGYVFREKDSSGQKLGLIDLDCHFSPVKNVSFSISDARVDKFVDFDKITLNILTDGSITADKVIGIGSAILRDMLTPLIDFDCDNLIDQVQENDEVHEIDYDLNLLRKITDLELSVRSSNCFTQASIEYIGDLVSRTEMEMLRMNNFGRKSLEEIKVCLNAMNLRLGMDIQWPPENMEELLKLSKESLESN